MAMGGWMVEKHDRPAHLTVCGTDQPEVFRDPLRMTLSWPKKSEWGRRTETEARTDWWLARTTSGRPAAQGAETRSRMSFQLKGKRAARACMS